MPALSVFCVCAVSNCIYLLFLAGDWKFWQGNPDLSVPADAIANEQWGPMFVYVYIVVSFLCCVCAVCMLCVCCLYAVFVTNFLFVCAQFLCHELKSWKPFIGINPDSEISAVDITNNFRESVYKGYKLHTAELFAYVEWLIWQVTRSAPQQGTEDFAW